jgi:predicted GIY-YIG superfamily endonuclease
LKGDQYLEYVTFLLESLTNTLHNDNEIMMDRPQFGMFHQKQTSLPLYGEHICYMLVSLKDTKASYIGYTVNLRKRINTHNSTAGGSKGSNRPHLKPWGLLAYVAGFDSKELALKFERDWKIGIRNKQYSYRGMMPTRVRATLAKGLFHADDNLRLMICGEIN